MKKEQLKFILKWFTNILLGAIIIIIFVPSWRLAFSSTLQRVLMGRTELTESMNIPLDFSKEQWILFDSEQQMHSFNDFKGNLIEFAKQYFPDTYNDFNESDPGMMFIEMASYVGDTLSYYMDEQFKESMLAFAEEKKTIYEN